MIPSRLTVGLLLIASTIVVLPANAAADHIPPEQKCPIQGDNIQVCDTGACVALPIFNERIEQILDRIPGIPPKHGKRYLCTPPAPGHP